MAKLSPNQCQSSFILCLGVFFLQKVIDYGVFAGFELASSSSSGKEVSQALLIDDYNRVYVGCYHVWEKQHMKLESADGNSPFNESHGRKSCANKCMERNLQGSHLVFIRGLECQCASAEFGIDSLNVWEDLCNYKCPDDSFSKSFTSSQNECGGNIAYSVYCVSASTTGCAFLMSKINQINAVTKGWQLSPVRNNVETNLDPVLEIPCGLCYDDERCRPRNISPTFDYFPVNSKMACVSFCGSSISYVDRDDVGVVYPPLVRPATIYAALLWWKVENSDLKLPMCWCVNEEIKQILLLAESRCEGCPGNSNDSCGGAENNSHEIYASLYCIEDGSGRCPGASTTTTPKTEVSSSTTLKSSSTTRIPTTTTTTPISSSETSLAPTEFETTSMPPSTLETTVSTSTRGTTTAAANSTTSAATTDFGTPPMPPSTMETTITSDSAESTTSIATSTMFGSTYSTDHAQGCSPTSSSTAPDYNCKTRCRFEYRHNFTRQVCANETQKISCSELIAGSVGDTFLKCDEKDVNESPQLVDVWKCKSSWVDLKEKELNAVNTTIKAFNLTYSLTDGCSKTDQEEYKYFGHEIVNFANLVNETLWKVRNFKRPPSQDEFEDIVTLAVDLHACLINTLEPWQDLSLGYKSHLSTQLVQATENVLFHLTQFVHPDQTYSKVFRPKETFTAAAETFDRNNESVFNKEYEYPPVGDSDRKSCIKLPIGWTNLLTQDKVEIAVITITPESVARVVTGSGAYEVNGQKNKVINGRIISLSVTSSSHPIGYNSNLHIARSRSLNFPQKGVEITFHHDFDVDLRGDQTSIVSRKLHHGETPKAVLKSAKCVFLDTKTGLWSTQGCKVVRVSRVETVCECSHLTSFAVLMDVHSYIGRQLGLTILTLILCPLSEIALVFTIVILSMVGNGAQKARTTICKHLSFCLFLGNGMILVVLDRNYFYVNEEVCIGAAMTAHYVFLCAFMWMLFEGVQLYRMVVNVFDSGKSYMRHFGTVAYGTPLIIIAMTAAYGHIKGDQPYGGNAYCWLLGDYVWAFMGPIAVVITINLIVLFIALKTAYQLQHQGQSKMKLFPIFVMDKIRSYRMYFRSCFSLTVILGITWIVGFFTLMEGSSKVVAAYLFTILNASQGFFIFLFTCRTYKVRLLTQRKFSSYFPSLLNSSNNSSMIFKKPHIISKGKLDLATNESVRSN